MMCQKSIDNVDAKAMFHNLTRTMLVNHTREMSKHAKIIQPNFSNAFVKAKVGWKFKERFLNLSKVQERHGIYENCDYSSKKELLTSSALSYC